MQPFNILSRVIKTVLATASVLAMSSAEARSAGVAMVNVPRQ